MKTCRMILLALLMMVLVCAIAIAEPAAKYAVEGEELILFEQNDVKVYLTGETETIADCFSLNLVIENETDKSIHVYYNGVVNGWSLSSDYGATMSEIYPHSKGKGEIWFTFYDFDIREYADLEEMKLTFNVEDVATNEYIFTVDVGSIYFNAEMPADAEQTTSAEPVTEVTHSYEFPLPLDVKFGNSPEKVQLQEDNHGYEWSMENSVLTTAEREQFGVSAVSSRYHFENDQLKKIVYDFDMPDNEKAANAYYNTVLSVLKSMYGEPNGAGCGIRTSEYEVSQVVHQMAALIPGASAETLHDDEWYFECGEYNVKIDFVMNLSENSAAGTFGYMYHLGIEAFGDLNAAQTAAEPLSIEMVAVPVEEPAAEEPKYETLQKGSKGEDVKTMQNALKALGYLSGTVDGDFGPGTEKAVKAFQSAENLEANGIADSYTLEKLYSIELPEPQDLDVKITKLVNNSIGTPEIYVRFTNLSDKPIDRIDFLVYSYDAYGDLIKPYGHYDCTSFFFDDQAINPGKTTASDWYWTLYDCDGTTKVRLVIEKYHFKGGETVTVPYSDYVWYTYEK